MPIIRHKCDNDNKTDLVDATQRRDFPTDLRYVYHRFTVTAASYDVEDPRQRGIRLGIGINWVTSFQYPLCKYNK